MPTVDISRVAEKLLTRLSERDQEIAMLQVHVDDLNEEIRILKEQLGRKADTEEAREALQRNESGADGEQKEHTG